MKNSILFIVLLMAFYLGKSQTPKDYTVPLSVSIDTTTPSITLHWESSTAVSYSIYRKDKMAISWDFIGSLSASATSYRDTSILKSTWYDYKVVKNASGYTGYGYISSAIELPRVDNRGILILVVDSMVARLGSDLNTYRKLVEADGWIVKVIVCDTADLVTETKTRIVDIYNEDPTQTRSIFILGHVPVPYSGNYTTPPDGHTDHVAAWPTDAYYADIDGMWTDITVNNTSGSVRNHNTPGDRKFDHSVLPSDAELEIGRVDFHNLPILGSVSEDSLYKTYLRKINKYRSGNYVMPNRAVVDDNFGSMSGEAFAASAWKSFAPIIYDSTIIQDDLRTRCNAAPYKFSYGCGPGSYETCGGVCSSTDLAVDSIQSVFNMLFGSYFGDWDSYNNLMRCMIARGSVLSTCWSGRPHWYLHPMAMGEPIGYAQKMTQNNTTLYYSNIFANNIHISLMGDPTLRAEMIVPPKNVVATFQYPNVKIRWDSISNVGINGYIVFKKNTQGTMDAISPLLTNTNEFIYRCTPRLGIEDFFVKAIRLEKTPSGTYFNSSIGNGDTALITRIDSINSEIVVRSINTTTGTIDFELNTTMPQVSSYFWTFGDGTFSTDSMPVHRFTTSGTYYVRVIINNGCIADTIRDTVTMWYSSLNEPVVSSVNVYPIPCNDYLYIDSKTDILNLTLYDMQGNTVLIHQLPKNRIHTAALSKGLYILKLEQSNHSFVYKRVIKE